MANTYFQFKKFIVHQAHTSMKVCTDACLFGGWVAHDTTLLSANTILDIGTGTGLLSLMLAQATASNTDPAKITAIEIETEAAKEAASNFALSPWSNNLKIVHSSLQEFSNQIIQDHLNINHVDAAINIEDSSVSMFDCIITNPPFYEGDLKSPDAKKNLASHSVGLPWTVLVEHVSHLLKEGGSYFVLIPALRAYTMQKLAEATGLQLMEEVLVHNTAKMLPIRAMQKFIKPSPEQKEQGSVVKRSKIFIKDADNQYDAHFTALLKDYYLQF